MGNSSSREHFQSSLSILCEKDISGNPNDSEAAAFWDELWKASVSLEELYECITPQEIAIFMGKFLSFTFFYMS